MLEIEVKTNVDNGIDSLDKVIIELNKSQEYFEQEYGFPCGQIQAAILFAETASRIFKGIE